MSTDPKKEQKRNPKIEPDQIHPSSRLLPQVPQRTPPLPPTEPELPLQITEQANGLQVATRMDNEKLNIVRFNGNDFGVWKAQVEAVFTMKSIQSALVMNESEVAEAQRPTFNECNLKAKALLLCSLEPKYARMVIKCRTAKEIWDRLSAVHEQNSVSSVMVLQRDFFDLKMKPGEKVQDYVSRAEILSSQLDDIGAKMSEKTVVAKIASGLSEEYQSFMTYWMNTTEPEQTIGNLLAKLMAEEHMKSQFKKPDSAAHSSGGKTSGGHRRGKNNSKGVKNMISITRVMHMGELEMT